MGRISRGWRLAKLSLRVVRKDKELLLFPIIAGLIMVLIVTGFILGIIFSLGFSGIAEGSAPYLILAGVVVMYILMYFVAIFFQVAIIGCAMIRLDGGDPTLKDGFRIGRENIGRIFAWTLIAATVGLILSSLQQRSGIIGRIVIGFVGAAWSLATFFVLPVLVFEKVGPVQAMKRSISLFRKSWGETIVGGIGLGLIFVLAGLLGLLPIVIGLVIGGITGALVGLIVAFFYWIALAILASAASSVLNAALYRYATTGKLAEEIGPEQLYTNPWKY